MNRLELSDRQRATIASAATVLAAVVILLAGASLLYLVGAFFSRFSGVFLPLAVAGVLALVLKPYHEWLCARLRLPRVVALLVVFLSVLIPSGALMWAFGAVIVDQLSELFEPEFWRRIKTQAQENWPRVRTFFEQHPWGLRIAAAYETQQQAVMTELGNLSGRALSAGAGVLRGVGGLLGWVVMPVYLAFFLLARTTAFEGRDLLPFLKEDTRNDVIYLGREFVEILVAFFRGQLIIALMQGVLYAIGFSIVGLKAGFVLGLTLGFLNIIPYLGSIVGLGVALPLAMWQPDGGPWLVLWVLVVFTAVQSIEGYILTPRIMGNQTGLHPMVIIIAIFFWGSALGGISGMILAIPLTAFLVIFWRLAKEKYIAELL